MVDKSKAEPLVERIKKIRKSSKMTLQQFSEVLDIETRSLQAIEGGRRIPHALTLLQIITEANVEPNVLFQDYYPTKPNTPTIEHKTILIQRALKQMTKKEENMVMQIIDMILENKKKKQIQSGGD